MQVLRAMPVVDLEMPTLCLVGAPNVGKSSLVRILSTGKPEVLPFVPTFILVLILTCIPLYDILFGLSDLQLSFHNQRDSDGPCHFELPTVSGYITCFVSSNHIPHDLDC